MSPSGSSRKRPPGRSRPTPTRAVKGSRRGGILGKIARRPPVTADGALPKDAELYEMTAGLGVRGHRAPVEAETLLLQRFQVLDEISSLGGGQAELHERVVVVHHVLQGGEASVVISSDRARQQVS